MKYLKKTLSLLLVVLMFVNMVPSVFAAEGDPNITLTADKESLTVGEKLTVTVACDQAITNAFGSSMKISVDNSVFELVEEECSTAYDLTNMVAGKGWVKLSTYDLNYALEVSGTIATLVFKAVATAESSSVSLSELEIVDENGDYFACNAPAALNVAVVAVPVAKGYTVTAEADKEANIGENVSVSFTVGNTEANVTEYNAYDLTLTYDTAKLSYVSATAADADASIREADGTLRVIGYGESKALGTAVVTLNFTTLAAGDAAVTVSAAAVDNRANAPDKNTPAATLADDTTVITVAEKYNVTLGEGLTADTLVAESGKNYTFKATDYENYDYVVTATINGSSITVTDNGDGTYTIPGAAITGPITVSAAMTGKEQTVTVQGSGAADVVAESKANYGTDYTFTVNKAVGYTYTVTASVNGTAVTATDNGDGTYTIAGASITGPVTVAVTKTADVEESKKVTVSKPAYVSGAEGGVKGEDYSFTITTEPGYTYSEPSVTVNGKSVEVTKDENTGAYIIPGDKIDGDIVIRVTRTSSTGIAVTEYITLDEKSMYLITVSNVTEAGNIAKYAGSSMYWSPSYNAYAWLVVSDKNLTEMETEAANNVTVAAGTAAATIAYAGDVNMTNKTDVNDAQLTYDMYKARYDGFETVSMEKFLRADVNVSRAVDTQDAAAIVAAIQTP